MTEDFRGPAARGFDWDHILERHSEGGIVARQSGIKTVFVGLTEDQIKARVRAAWRARKRLRSQFGLSGASVSFIKKRTRAAAKWYSSGTMLVPGSWRRPTR